MAINATDTGVKRELIPAGNYPARCYSMLHIGTIEENIMGDIKRLNRVNITWELPTETRVFKEENGEQPMVISQEFTLSMNEKANLRKFLESWIGKGFTEEEAKNFDITKLLGKPCMLSIIHKKSQKGSEYAIISSVATMPKGMECPEQINATLEFNFDDKFDVKVLESFPEFIKDKIKRSEEYKKKTMPEHTDVIEDAVYDNLNGDKDLPF
jgi:uncharacterized protein (DUF2249 family)